MNSRPESASAPSSARPADLFRIAFHNSPAMQTLTRTTDRVLVEANDTFLKTMGFAREEVLGKAALELNLWVHPERAVPFRARLAAEGRVRGYEVEVRTKRGEIRTVLLSADLVDIDGVPHVVAAGVDITARQQTEAELRQTHERLRQSEERFSKAFHANPTMMTITRFDDGKFVSVNDAFLRTIGYTAEEVIGQTGKDLQLHVDPEQRGEFYRRMRDHGFVRDMELVIRTKDGRLRTLLASGELTDVEGRPHMLTAALDITERKQADGELQLALQRERELSQLRTDFVSLVSHEFRTPLEIIMSSVDNLDRYHERLAAEQRRELLRTINKSVRRMAGMMEEVLLLGRLDSGGTEFKPTPLDLPVFCRRVCDEMESATNRRCPIVLSLELGSDGDAAFAHGDEAVLRHILTNLLSNAVKYSRAGEPAELAVRCDGEMTEFRVSDRGCGIPADDQQRLFQAFHRGSNVRQIPGTGLGLLIVRRCVDLHGGAIAFESAEGRGTTFTVRLPLFEKKS